MSFQIIPERPQDAVLIDPLLDRTFGLARRQRTVYRLREGVAPAAALSFSTIDDADGSLLASLRFWPIRIGHWPALLLGPLAVEPVLQGCGLGKALVRHGLAQAVRHGHQICVVVGAPAYYRPVGFRSAAAAGIIMPGPVEAERFQAADLVPGALEGVHGVIGRAEAAPSSDVAAVASA